MITNELLMYVISEEYPDAKHFVNFWCGHKNTGETQEHDSEILGWEIDAEQPDERRINELVSKHKSGFVNPAIRYSRDGLLRELDVVVSNPLRYTEFTEQQKLAISQYRQDLLDVPQQPGFPDDVEWPEKPAFLM